MTENETVKGNDGSGKSRRAFLRSLAGVPVLGFFAVKLLQKQGHDQHIKKQILEELGLSGKAPAVRGSRLGKKPGDLLRLGIIGFGGRGEYLVKAAGFAHPQWTRDMIENAKKDRLDRELEIFLNQEDLNVAVTAVCDVFDVRARRGLQAAANTFGPGAGGRRPPGAKRYRRYQELLASPDVDAVLIATPDHWHAPMAIAAAQAGKHVYVEKCMTRTEEEVHQLAAAIRSSRIVFQLGHQNPQQVTFQRAREIIEKNILGPITLVETTTNRNSPNGAWVYDIHPAGSPATIDWEHFQEPSPHKVPFSRERFFRWRCWYDYGTGLAGDLLSHEFDAVNQILGMGIPRYATASGGIYFYRDGRDVPDVFQVVFEYPERNLTFVYSATLASNRERGRVFMGHDGSMEVGGTLTINVDPESTRYRDKIARQVIDPSLPLFAFQPGAKGIDAVTSATEKYFASKGLMYTSREGRNIDVTHLHIKEWIDCIRGGGQPSCGIERGIEEAISCHMATRAFLLGRRVEWDPVKQRIA